MAAPRICSVEGCGKRAVARGFCNPHWHRWRRYGDPLLGRLPREEARNRKRSVEGCDKPHNARGFCSPHYATWVRHGDPLGSDPEWGRAKRFFEDVVLNHSKDECLIWPFNRDKDGYGVLWRDGKNRKVHRLACEAVNGEPPTPDHIATHTCGKGREGCCALSHQVWNTQLGNSKDRLKHGTLGFKLTEQDVRQIRSLEGKYTQKQIGEMFSVSGSLVGEILSRKIWKWL